MFVSLTNKNTVDEPVREVLSVVIRTAIGKQAPTLSLSYRFADFDPAGMVQAFRPNLQLPVDDP